jgi:probable DNA repair protein
MPYLYGFKTLTPEQTLLFDKVGYQALNTKQNNTQQDNQIFQTSNDEILSAAKWAKNINDAHPLKNIAIVCPTLNSEHHQIKSIFDTVFGDTLTEVGQKSYNISLGLPLTEYPLIRHIIAILELSGQLQNNRINTKTLNAVITSPYIAFAEEEQSARALLVNRVLSFSKVFFKFSTLEKYLDKTPKLKALIKLSIKQTSKNKQPYDQWLVDFDTHLQVWGLVTNRTLSSTEYQLFNKYQQASSELNCMAQTSDKINASHAILDLKKWLSQVVFQAQSAKTPIQILGSLEAEGLYFDAAWVLGMTDNFLPMPLNSPRFIPSSIAQQHQIPHSSFALIAKDAQDTLNNLINLADAVIFSYAKTHFGNEQRPSPLLTFNTENSALKHTYQSAPLNTLADAKATPLKDKQVRNGVGILKDQMACEFKGFAQRLNTRIFDDPHIGLDRKEQGKIVHCALQYFYQEITSQAELLALDEIQLDTLVQEKINDAIQYYAESGFKNNEKIRISTIIHRFIKTDKKREAFTVLSTEKSIDVDISGLKFTTRLDRLDEIEGGDKIIFDYKIGNPYISDWQGEAIKEPQLPIYAVTNDTQGIAFIQLNADKISTKGIFRSEKTSEWNAQIDHWQEILENASNTFQNGIATVLPNKTACDYCDFDALCRVEK